MRFSRGQSMVEYSIIVGLVAAILFTMGPFLRRGINSVVKLTADQIANQQDAEQRVTNRSGYLVDTRTAQQAITSKNTKEWLGDTNYYYNDADVSQTTSLVNLGFSNR